MASDYAKIYELQDEILNLLFSRDANWYLTGGTALSRFYLNHRYSDDLDFFSTEPAWFAESFRETRRELFEKKPGIEISVDARDFKRLIVPGEFGNLKLDFVCDRTPRIGQPVLTGSWTIDTVRNMASNKIGTLLGRDEPRDAADLLAITRNRSFSWKDLIDETRQKELFNFEDLIYRCRTFPLELLDEVPFFAPRDPEADNRDWSILIRDMETLAPNTLAPAESREL